MIPSVGLGIFITRIGCFFNGCCYGLPTDRSWGMVFPQESPAGAFFPNQAIHPTQLYSSFYGLLIFVLILFVERFKKYDGFLLYFFFICYGIARFTVDFFRYYESSMVIGGLSISVNQGISLGLIILGVLFLVVSALRQKKAEKTGVALS